MGNTVIHDDYQLVPLSKMADGNWLIRMIDASDGTVHAFPMTEAAAKEFITTAYHTLSGLVILPDREAKK